MIAVGIILAKLFLAAVFGFIGSAIFFITSLPRRFGAGYIDFHFNAKLESIRSEQQSTVTRLKSQLDQLLDRGIRANEKEFDATILVWEKLISAYIVTNICAIAFIQYPDLNISTFEELDLFLSKTEFSDDQKQKIMSSSNKNQAYSRQVRLNDVGKAEHAIYEARITLMKESIFINESVKKRISEEIDLYHGCRIEKWINFREDTRIPEEKTAKVIKDGIANLAQIESMLRDRLCKT